MWKGPFVKYWGQRYLQYYCIYCNKSPAVYFDGGYEFELGPFCQQHAEEFCKEMLDQFDNDNKFEYTFLKKNKDGAKVFTRREITPQKSSSKETS